MAWMPRSAQNVVSSPSKPSTCTLGNSPQTSRSISIRASGVNRRFFDLLTPTATTTSSKSPEAREMMSRCPLVTGSKDPGQTARRTGLLLGGWRGRGVTVPKHGLAVALLPDAGEALGPLRLGAARGALDDDEGARHQPGVGGEGPQVVGDGRVV